MLRVIVDEREKPSGVPKLLSESGVHVEYRMLNVGDYIISPVCAVERKQIMDFQRSIFSGRIFNQASQLSSFYRIPILLVEGEFNNLIRESSNPRSLWGGLITLSLGYGLHVFFTDGPSQTSDFIVTLSRRRDIIGPRGPMITKIRKSRDLRSLQRTVVSTLPEIGPKLAGYLLTHFGSVRNVFSASASELVKVEGIGRIRAEAISNFLDAPYKTVSDSKTQSKLCY